MQTTTNYGLKKPEGNEFVSVDDLNYNADEIDKALKKLDDDKVDASGGDIASTKVSAFTETTASFPVPESGESPKTLWGKVKKFIEDFKSWMSGVCLLGQLVSNTTTNNANLPASAAAVYQAAQQILQRAPTSHASTATTYGQGNASNFGHVKVSDNYTASAGAASAGVAASSKAVVDAYNALNTNGILSSLKYMDPTYIDDPPAYFKLSGYNYVAYMTRSSLKMGESSSQYALVFGVHDNNNGNIKGVQIAIGTSRVARRFFTINTGWSAWMDM